MEEPKKENEKAFAIHNVMQRTLEMKLKAYESVCAWFEKEYDSNSDEDTVREWEDKSKELNAQINMLRHLLMETKQYVA
jgi:hypothetical protein